jgi:hypothetical protein
LVPGGSAEEHASGIAAEASDALFEPGATPDPAMSEPPVIVGFGRLVHAHASAVLPKSQVSPIDGDQAAP